MVKLRNQSRQELQTTNQRLLAVIHQLENAVAVRNAELDQLRASTTATTPPPQRGAQ